MLSKLDSKLRGFVRRDLILAVALAASVAGLVWSLMLDEIPLQIRYVLAIVAGAFLMPLLRILASAGGRALAVSHEVETTVAVDNGIFYDAVEVICNLRMPPTEPDEGSAAEILVTVRIMLTVRYAPSLSKRPLAVDFAIPTVPGSLRKSRLSRQVGLRSLTIDAASYSSEELHSVNERMHSDLKTVGDDQLAHLRFQLELWPGEARRVAIEYVLLKKQFDFELFTWQHPVKGLQLIAFDQTGLDLALYARALASATIEQASEADAGAMRRWALLDTFEPGEGLVFWWEPTSAPIALLPHVEAEAP